MTSPEPKRLDLYNRLQEVLGTDPATTPMTYLPPVETPDLITRTEFKAEMDRIDKRFSELDKKVDRVLVAVVGGLFVMLAALIGSGLLS